LRAERGEREREREREKGFVFQTFKLQSNKIHAFES
jgi:hypothetical protein